MNRESARLNALPQLHELRDSGNIEQDADNVIMLHRERDDNGNYNESEMDVFIRKARNARLGAIKMDLKLQFMQINERPFTQKTN